MQAQGACLLDVREEHERACGSPLGALGLSRSFLELKIQQLQADFTRPMLTLCQSGQRSLFAAETLKRLGYQQVQSIAGGFKRWQAEGLPSARHLLDADARERYLRQLCLPQVGEEGQQKLASSRVAILGAGGLGSPAALYLAAAGVGQISVIDDDCVERSNLQRQIMHTDARVGMRKIDSARITLSALNPHITLHMHAQRLRPDNATRLLASHDLVIDGTDNFPSRYLLAAASIELQLPVIYGAVERFHGQVSVFDPRRDDSPCYRCLFAESSSPGKDRPSCSEAGVIGVLPGIIGLLQATEALKLLLGIGLPLTGRLLSLDALSMRFRETRLTRDRHCLGCSTDRTEFARPHAALTSG